MSNNTWYTIKTTWENNLWSVYRNEILQGTKSFDINTTIKSNDAMVFGSESVGGKRYYSFRNGFIDLKDCYIKVDNQEVWTGIIPGTASNYDYYEEEPSYTYYWSKTVS